MPFTQFLTGPELGISPLLPLSLLLLCPPSLLKASRKLTTLKITYLRAIGIARFNIKFPTAGRIFITINPICSAVIINSDIVDVLRQRVPKIRNMRPVMDNLIGNNTARLSIGDNASRELA